MDMKDRLSGITAVVDDHPIATIIEPALFSKRLRNEEQMPDELAVYVFNTVNVLDMLFRHDQNMDRRLRVDILECDSMFVFVDQFGGHLFFDYLAEDAVWVVTHFTSPYSRAKLRKKQLFSPVWHAGPVWSTLMSNVSRSQSYRMSFTFWTWPDVSPFCQNFCRERLQNQVNPVSTVFFTDAAFM